MSGFRIGRKSAQHFYPESSRASALSLFARNFATGPKFSTALAPDAQIPWNSIDADVPTTPFTIAANGITVSIAGDVTAAFQNFDDVTVKPTVPASLTVVFRTIVTVPVFALGFTTFDINAAIDPTTTAGFISTSASVPITPRVTGVVRVSGVVTVSNPTVAPIDVEIGVQVNGGPTLTPDSEIASLLPGGVITIPFLVETNPLDTPIGVTSNIQVIVDGNGAEVVSSGSSIDVQEVSVATG
jgi:hypothetical protein